MSFQVPPCSYMRLAIHLSRAWGSQGHPGPHDFPDRTRRIWPIDTVELDSKIDIFSIPCNVELKCFCEGSNSDQPLTRWLVMSASHADLEQSAKPECNFDVDSRPRLVSCRWGSSGSSGTPRYLTVRSSLQSSGNQKRCHTRPLESPCSECLRAAFGSTHWRAPVGSDDRGWRYRNPGIPTPQTGGALLFFLRA